MEEAFGDDPPEAQVLSTYLDCSQGQGLLKCSAKPRQVTPKPALMLRGDVETNTQFPSNPSNFRSWAVFDRASSRLRSLKELPDMNIPSSY